MLVITAELTGEGFEVPKPERKSIKPRDPADGVFCAAVWAASNRDGVMELEFGASFEDRTVVLEWDIGKERFEAVLPDINMPWPRSTSPSCSWPSKPVASSKCSMDFLFCTDLGPHASALP
jgi:hypothetical protein